MREPLANRGTNVAKPDLRQESFTISNYESTGNISYLAQSLNIESDNETDSASNAPTALESATDFLRRSHSTSASQLGESDRARIGAEQREYLLRWAEAQGLTSAFSTRPQDDCHRLLGLEGSVAGNEHSVVFPQSSGRVIKTTHPNKFGKAYPIVDGFPMHSNATPLEYLDRLQLSNQVSSDEVRLERVVIDQAGAMRLVTSQPLVVGAQPDDEDVHNALRDFQ